MDRISATNEVEFRVGFSGHSGHLRLEPLSPVHRPNPLLDSLPDFVIPPAFEPETPETLKKYVEEKYIRPELDHDEFSVANSGRQWDFDWFDRAKVELDPSAPTSVLVPSWELPFRRKTTRHGSLGVWDPDATEMEVSKIMEGAQGLGSRATGSSKDFVKTSTNNRPFYPGGLDGSQSSERVVPEGVLSGQWVKEILEGGLAQTTPPSCKKGMELGLLTGFPCQWNCSTGIQSHISQSPSIDNVSQLSMQFDDFFSKAWEEGIEEQDLEAGDQEDESRTDTSVDLHCEDAAGNELLISEYDLVDDHGKSDSQKKESEIWVDEQTEDIASKFDVLVPELVLNFPFELDKFQKEAIYYIEKGESVFVAAHTSAGKTVVAEYAFALASKHYTRAVYTAPIKTISNQKYRDFCEKFDVGLLTGDVSLKPDASCLIMTTEILRSMLYRGADIIRDIEWVIFDEVHYVNDIERGVVWEEVIIMLPRHVNIVLLSATVPNTKEFAEWIGRTKQKKIRVTGTSKRPVPLEHCLFYCGEFYKVCESETFLSQGLRAAKDAHRKKNSSISRSAGTGGKSAATTSHKSDHARKQAKPIHGREKHNTSSIIAQNNRGSWRSESSLWLLLINRLANKSLLPVVIFCFSKNRCDKSADNITGIDLTSSSEKNAINVFCKKAFARLKGSDRHLPQVVRVESLLKRGIGVHHAGLLPIVKEVVEMLFCRGLIKVLFSTETFSMGVNAPARTVVFDNLRKFDGREFRSLLPGEYIQMAGRAGRRGLDMIGTVVIMCRDDIPEEGELKHVMVGTPTRLESQFRLTYTMILHLLRLDELKVEDMLKRSFAEFHAQNKLPEKEKLLLLKLAQPTKTIECIKGEPAIEDYLDMASEAEKLGQHTSETIMRSPSIQPFLSPGRLIIVKSRSVEDHTLGVVIKTPSATARQYIVLLLGSNASETLSTAPSKLQESGSNLSGGYFILPKGRRDNEEYVSFSGARKGSGAINIKLPYSGNIAGSNYEVVGIESKEIFSICERKIKIDQIGLLEEPSTAVYSRTVQQLLQSKPQGNKYPASLDPLKDLKLNNIKIVEEYHRYNHLLQNMSENKCHGCVKLKEHLSMMKEIKKHKEEVNALKYQMSDEALQQMPDFQGRIDVLKEINCIDSDLVVQIKGRVACEMNSGEELICTECLFENQLEELEPEEAVALMSAFVFQQKNTSKPNLSFKLLNAKKRLYDTAIRLGELQAHFNLAVNPEEYAQESLKFGLVEVVYEWAKGTPFAEICELTDVPEGLIVRTIVRLDETCREFRNAASIMGNSALHEKMEIASNAIKRDIVFAASLYVTGV